MEVFEAILARRSVRKFTDQPVPRDLLEKLLVAAMAAPSATNKQPWEFVVVDEAEGMRRLGHVLILGRYGAPCAVVVCGNLKRAQIPPARDFWIQDASAAMENLLLAATGMGLGGVWIGVTPIKPFAAAVGRVLRLPKHIVPLGVAMLGWPAVTPEPRSQYDPAKVHWQTYTGEPADAAETPKA